MHHVSEAKTTQPPQKRGLSASEVASRSKRSRDPLSRLPPPQQVTLFHTTTAHKQKNNARLAFLPPIVPNAYHLPPPPSKPRVSAQDSLATLAPQRQHPWLCLVLFQHRQSPATTQLHEHRELRRVGDDDDKTTATEQQFLLRRSRRSSALLETRHQARAGC